MENILVINGCVWVDTHDRVVDFSFSGHLGPEIAKGMTANKAEKLAIKAGWKSMFVRNCTLGKALYFSFVGVKNESVA